MPGWIRFTLTSLTCAGLALSSYLVWLSLDHSAQPMLGCGETGGCEDVLNSKWSRLGPTPIPIAAMAAAVYLGLLVLLHLVPRSLRRPWLFGVAAGLLIGAAVWFTAVQAFILQAWCPLCMTAHAIGIATGLTLLVSRNLSGTKGSPRSPLAALLGLAGVAALAFVQWLSPTPEAPTGVVLETSPKASTAAATQASSAASASAPPAAEPITIEVFYDYACPKCRRLHRELRQSQADDPNAWRGIRLVNTPVSIGRGCGGPLQLDHPRFTESCDRTRVALTVRGLSEQAFQAFDTRMMEGRESPTLQETTALARRTLADYGLKWPGTDAGRELLSVNQERFSELIAAYTRRAIPVIQINGPRSSQTVVSYSPAFILEAARSTRSSSSAE